MELFEKPPFQVYFSQQNVSKSFFFEHFKIFINDIDHPIIRQRDATPERIHDWLIRYHKSRETSAVRTRGLSGCL